MAGPLLSQSVSSKKKAKIIYSSILMRCPAHELHNVMRSVCRQWRRIIDDPLFVSNHSQLATSTFLMYDWGGLISTYRLLNVKECHIELVDFRFNIPYEYDVCTCNGLVLIVRKLGKRAGRVYYVGNPLTRRLLKLPQFDSPNIYCVRIAFESSSQVYKVVVVYGTTRRPWFPLGCAILTVGIDEAWRFLDFANLTRDDMVSLSRRSRITSTDFVYWVSTSSSYMLALDLKSESIKRISLPLAYEGLPELHYLPKGNSISVWYTKMDFSMEVWLLKDYITEEWVKFLNIDGDPIRKELGKVLKGSKLDPFRKAATPRGWLGNFERILFDANVGIPFMFVYDFKTRTCYGLHVGFKTRTSSLLPFVNTLAWVS